MTAAPPPTDDAPVRGVELAPHVARWRNRIPPPLLRAGRSGGRAAGIATASSRDLPDFLIIGAKKAGTSSLMNWLLRHRSVARMFPAAQRLKSPHYFDVNYWHGQRWYRSHFASRRARRQQEQSIGGPVVTGEASPYYMFHPAAPSRVARDLPHVKVIALLRDPVSRAYSNYADRRAAGHEPLATFEEALAAEPDRLRTVDQQRLIDDPRYYSYHHDHHLYLARGRYLEHLAPWLDQIDPERILVLPAESMFADPGGTFETVQRFLGIDLDPDVALRRYNQRSGPGMDSATRAWLEDYYRPHNAALYAALGTDLGWDAPKDTDAAG